MALANEGLRVERPVDAIRDPYVLEFLDLPESHRLVARFVLGEDNQQVFASRYKLHLPTEEELRAELDRELAQLRDARPKRTPGRKKA